MSSKQKRIGVKDYYYTFDAIKNISKEKGFLASLDKDWPQDGSEMVQLIKI